MEFIAKYRHFALMRGQRESRPKATRYWVVNRRSGDLLGCVEWYAPWRQFCWHPTATTVWSDDCLADIRDCLAKVQEEHERIKETTNADN